MLLTLNRVLYRPDCTLGVMSCEGTPLCLTLEDAWNFNASNVSCIPPRMYNVQKYTSKRFPDTFEITNVPGRSYILIHAGNTELDTEGCVLLGTQFGELNKKIAVLDSRTALDKLRTFIGTTENIILEIK